MTKFDIGPLPVNISDYMVYWLALWTLKPAIRVQISVKPSYTFCCIFKNISNCAFFYNFCGFILYRSTSQMHVLIV